MRDQRRALERAWYSGAWWLWLLRPLEMVFRSVAVLRRQLYQRRLLGRYRPERPVIIVGNITVGGTGKTPVVVALVEALRERGIAAGVVSRGYGATAGQFPHTVNDASTAEDCGDEPLLIYRRARCPCVVAPSRASAVRVLLQEFKVDVVISDDGLQHYALARDLEIAVLDARAGVGNGFCLPAGPLREPASRLQSVDFVLYRGSADPASGVRYEQDSLVNLVTGERRPVSPEAVGRSIYAVAGIGQPLHFFDALAEQGFRVDSYAFSDHYRYTAADFSALQDRPIIMTEKDAVKCRDLAGDNAWYLEISARLPPEVPLAAEAVVQTWAIPK